MFVYLNLAVLIAIVSNHLLIFIHGMKYFYWSKLKINNNFDYSVCGIGYTGVNCATQINFCVPNPCVNGQCASQLSTYVCTCNTGYQGKNCDQAINLCLLTQCVNGGTCLTTGPGTYTCQCLPGYTGLQQMNVWTL